VANLVTEGVLGSLGLPFTRLKDEADGSSPTRSLSSTPTSSPSPSENGLRRGVCGGSDFALTGVCVDCELDRDGVNGARGLFNAASQALAIGPPSWLLMLASITRACISGDNLLRVSNVLVGDSGCIRARVGSWYDLEGSVGDGLIDCNIVWSTIDAMERVLSILESEIPWCDVI